MTILLNEPRFWPEITTARRRRETLLALGDREAYEEALSRRRVQAWELDPERACAVFCSRGGHRRFDLEVACREILGGASRKLMSRIYKACWKNRDRGSGMASYHGDLRIPVPLSLPSEERRWQRDISKRKPGNVRDRALMSLAQRLLSEVFGDGKGPRIDVSQGRLVTLVRKGPRGRLQYDLTITADLFRVPPEDRCAERVLRLSPDMRLRGFKNRHLVLERLEPSGWKQLKGRW